MSHINSIISNVIVIDTLTLNQVNPNKIIVNTLKLSQKYDSLQESNNQRTNGPVNAHLISWPSKAQNIQNLENIW